MSAKLCVMAPDGQRCFGYGINEHGQAECYWPDCGCTPDARRTAFIQSAKGHPAHIVARAMNRLCERPKINWTYTSKKEMAEAFATGGTQQAKDRLFLTALSIDAFRAALTAAKDRTSCVGKEDGINATCGAEQACGIQGKESV